MTMTPTTLCRIHGTPLTYTLADVLSCRRCREEAHTVKSACARDLALQLGKLADTDAAGERLERN